MSRGKQRSRSNRRETKRARRIKIGLLGVAGVAVIALVFIALTMDRSRSSYVRSPAAQATATAPAAPDRVSVLFIGDSYTYGSPMGGAKYAGWPTALSAANRWTAAPYAQGGAGYVEPGLSEQTFDLQLQAAKKAGVKPGIMIVEGGRNDRFLADKVPAAADALFSDIDAAWPDAKIVAIGPIWTATQPGEEMLRIRDAVASAAANVGASFIDPLADGWFMGDSADFVGVDMTHPTPEGIIYLGDLIQAGLLKNRIVT